MGAAPTNKLNSDGDATNSMWMKLIQLWLTSFAIGIPSLRLLFFLDFRVNDVATTKHWLLAKPLTVPSFVHRIGK